MEGLFSPWPVVSCPAEPGTGVRTAREAGPDLQYNAMAGWGWRLLRPAALLSAGSLLSLACPGCWAALGLAGLGLLVSLLVRTDSAPGPPWETAAWVNCLLRELWPRLAAPLPAQLPGLPLRLTSVGCRPPVVSEVRTGGPPGQLDLGLSYNGDCELELTAGPRVTLHHLALAGQARLRLESTGPSTVSLLARPRLAWKLGGWAGLPGISHLLRLLLLVWTEHQLVLPSSKPLPLISTEPETGTENREPEAAGPAGVLCFTLVQSKQFTQVTLHITHYTAQPTNLSDSFVFLKTLIFMTRKAIH